MLLLFLACGVLLFDDGDSSNEVDTSDSASEPEANWCDDELSVAEPAGPDCASATLGCGEVVTATTEGGYSDFVGDNYTSQFCFPNLDRASYGGPERIYVVELGDGAYAEAVLSADCARMGLSAMRWPKAGECPHGETTVTVCDGKEGTGPLAVTFGGYETQNRWVLVVDTADELPAAFRLTLACAS